MKKWRILAQHKWVDGATITESAMIDSPKSFRRFTATIRGYQNWRIWQGPTAYREMQPRVTKIIIIRLVTDIKDRIDRGDQTVFFRPGAW